MSPTSAIGITAFEVERYRPFEPPTRVELGRVTILIGRNNAGKSALCFAPLYFAQALRPGANAPLPSGDNDLGFGSPVSAIYRRHAAGTRGWFGLENADGTEAVEIGITVIPERLNEQKVTSLGFYDENGRAESYGLMSWPEAQERISKRPALRELSERIGALRGVRPLPPREYSYLGYSPENVGLQGEKAAMLLLASGQEGLDAINTSYEQLGVRLSIEKRDDRFAVLATGASREAVNLVESGSGIAQVLPLFVQLKLAPRLPRLWCVEQPELHLHPGVHGVVADALIEGLEKEPLSRILIETHSDTLVLRMRRHVAEGRIKAKDLRIYFVDEHGDGDTTVKEVPLDQDGTPTWWPRGVFAEPQQEYFAIRRAITSRNEATS